MEHTKEPIAEYTAEELFKLLPWNIEIGEDMPDNYELSIDKTCSETALCYYKDDAEDNRFEGYLIQFERTTLNQALYELYLWIRENYPNEIRGDK
jgi:hypothetical protein